MKQKILAVDDEPDAVELIKFNLKAAGYEVLTAADGDEALKKARAAPAQLDHSGLDAARSGWLGGLQDSPARSTSLGHPDHHAHGQGGGNRPRAGLGTGGG